MALSFTWYIVVELRYQMQKEDMSEPTASRLKLATRAQTCGSVEPLGGLFQVLWLMKLPATFLQLSAKLPANVAKGKLNPLCCSGGSSPVNASSVFQKLVAIGQAPTQLADVVMLASSLLMAIGGICAVPKMVDIGLMDREEQPTNGAALEAAPAEDAAAGLAAGLAAAMPGIPGMDPAAYAQWLQALQAQQVAAQQLYLQQIAAASAGGVFAVPQVAGAIPGLAGAAALPGLGAAAALPGLARGLPGLAPKAEGPVYTGQVVDYNEDRGFGFIECKETQELYGGKDIFLLRSGLNGLIVSTGDRVNFRVERGIKGPKAVEVEVVERIQDMAERLPRYYGIVKNFDNTRGLGFIECEETKEVYDKDTWWE
eukprot:s3088_g5.t2